MNVKRSDIPLLVDEELYAEQIRLEKMMETQGQKRYFDALTENIKKERGDKTTYGSALIAKNIEGLSECIAKEIQAKTTGYARRVPAWILMQDIDPKKLSMITMQCLTTRMMVQTPLASLNVAIGKAVEDEIRMVGIRAQDDRCYATLMKGNKFRSSQNNKRAAAIRINRDLSAHEEWDEKTRLRCGLVLFHCVQDALQGVFEIAVLSDSTSSKVKTTKYVIPSPATINWMRDHVATAQFMRPMYQPMVVPPIRWGNSRVTGGGYVSNYVKPLTLVKVPTKKGLHVYTQTKMPAVFDAINAAQETAWTINNKVLDVIAEACEREITIGSMPTLEDLPIPELPPNYTDAELTEYKRTKRDNIAENVQRRCKAANFHIIISQAKAYKDYEKIYIPHQLDFRGRLYGVPMLNAQGADYTKGLLQFGEAKAIGTSEALCYLFIHVANLFGIDKVSFDERIAWTDERLSELAMCATDPWGNQIWTEADKPFQALAACHEILGYLSNGLDHKCRMAVALDGSCSGLQNLGMALSCEVTGSSVNLIPMDQPQDIYANVAEQVTEQLRELCDYDSIKSLTTTLHKVQIAAIQGFVTQLLPLDSILNNISKPFENLTKTDKEIRKAYLKPKIAFQWLELGVTRTICKRPVMTYPYGSKQYGFKQQIQEDTLRPLYALNDVPFTEGISEVASVLSEYVFSSVEGTVLKAAEAMNWLQESALILAAEGKPIVWQTPLGFTVTQNYRKTQLDKVSTMVNGTRYQVSLAKRLRELDVRKNANSISPNYVHSLDSSHLMLTVALAANEGMTDFALIHDSFGTHVADTPRFFNVIREAFLELYSADDVLNSLYSQFREQAKNPDDIPAPPSKGNLVKAQILDSLYAFA
jgi:DNA-directed RNA polymerase